MNTIKASMDEINFIDKNGKKVMVLKEDLDILDDFAKTLHKLKKEKEEKENKKDEGSKS